MGKRSFVKRWTFPGQTKLFVLPGEVGENHRHKMAEAGMLVARRVIRDPFLGWQIIFPLPLEIRHSEDLMPGG